MNLVTLCFLKGIEGIPLEVFKRVLDGTCSKIYLKKELKGMIVLEQAQKNKNILVKCVDKYYSPCSNTEENEIYGNNECYCVQQKYGITNIGYYNCLECHKKCIDMLSNHLINKI